jgi:hypothetical protein
MSVRATSHLSTEKLTFSESLTGVYIPLSPMQTNLKQQSYNLFLKRLSGIS